MAENVLLMKCTQCGESNQLPCVHCKRCGARLDFESAEQHMKAAAAKPPVEAVKQIIRGVVLFLLILSLLLLLWPAGMTRTTGEELDSRRYIMKGELLVDALNRGMPASQTIEESEINAYLARIVAAQPADGKAVLRDAAVRFFTNRTEGLITVKRGPCVFSLRIYARPEGDRLVVTGARMGHLPLPGLLGRAVVATQSGLFRQFKNESRILRNLDAVTVADGSVELLTRTP